MNVSVVAKSVLCRQNIQLATYEPPLPVLGFEFVVTMCCAALVR